MFLLICYSPYLLPPLNFSHIQPLPPLVPGCLLRLTCCVKLHLTVSSLIIHLLNFTIPIAPSYFSVMEDCSLSRGGTIYHLFLSHLYPPLARGKAGSCCIFSHSLQQLSSLPPKGRTLPSPQPTMPPPP